MVRCFRNFGKAVAYFIYIFGRTGNGSHPHDSVQGRTHFMAHAGKEIAFYQEGLFCPLFNIYQFLSYGLQFGTPLLIFYLNNFR